MKLILSLSLLLASLPLTASEFSNGPLIEGYGPNAEITQSQPLSGKERFKVSFDVAKTPGTDAVNSRYNSLARFLNMHVRAGVDPKNIQLALVVHGDASTDLLSKEAYNKRFGVDNPNADLLNELMKHQVQIYLCGQSATYHKVANSDLLKGVQMSLSAMTAHALLQQQGFTVNPF